MKRLPDELTIEVDPVSAATGHMMPWPLLFPEASDELSDQWSGEDQELPEDELEDDQVEDDRWGAQQ